MNQQHDRSISASIRRLAGTFSAQSITLTTGDVVSVDKSARQCVATIDNGVQLACNIMAVVGDGVFPVPSVGSTVLILYGTYENAFVILCSDIDEISFKGEELGGMVKVIELVSKLNTLESDLNSLKTVFSSWVPVASDGGAALKTAAATWYGQQITQTQRADLENESVKHGS